MSRQCQARTITGARCIRVDRRVASSLPRLCGRHLVMRSSGVLLHLIETVHQHLPTLAPAPHFSPQQEEFNIHPLHQQQEDIDIHPPPKRKERCALSTNND